MITNNSKKMNANIKNFGPLRKKWERYFAINQSGPKSIRQTATRAGLCYRALSRAIEDGVGSETIRKSLVAINIPEELIPLPTCTRTLAAMVYRQQEIIKTCQKNWSS
ncbi:MAG: hypothetical protein Q7J24_14905 [Desulfomicrobium sp.]|nr:hypothetical protein [Desulfomicrobium sp.]